MRTTNEFLDAIKTKHGLQSDYALAKKLGVKQSCICNYRSERSKFDDLMAIKAAGALEIDPLFIISAVHAERAKSEQEKAVWKGIYERLGGMAAAILLGLALIAPSPDASADGLKNVCNVYYVKCVWQ